MLVEEFPGFVEKIGWWVILSFLGRDLKKSFYNTFVTASFLVLSCLSNVGTYRLDEVADEEDSKYSWHDEDLSRWRKVNHWDSPGGGDILECGCCLAPGLCPLARLLLGKHPHLWTELFPPLLGTVRSVQVSAQGQLMRCEYVKLYPLSQGSYKHWSLGQNMI